MLGLSAWKRGDLAKSEQAFGQALSIDPHHVKSLVNSSRVFEQKRHGDAVGSSPRAAEIEPGSVEVHRRLGRTYHTSLHPEVAPFVRQRLLQNADELSR